MEIIQRSTSELIPYVNNARTHSDAQVTQIASSIKEFGFTNPILTDGDSGVIAGHGRLMAAKKMGMEQVPTIELSHLTPTQKKAYILADNKLAMNAVWDDELLNLELTDLNDAGFDLSIIGFESFELDFLDDGTSPGGANEDKTGVVGALSDKFMIPPFTVLNSREGWWRNRKDQWLSLGIKSEIGRINTWNSLAGAYKVKVNASSNNKIKVNDIDVIPAWADNSIFDPVLCEIAYRWFSPVGGLILDPFAGGSVRGIVASKLERQYIGHELRDEQVAANRVQGDELCLDEKYPPAWIAGDSCNIDKTCADVSADMVFSCPPYADLEVYSDNPLDISNMDYMDFKKSYFEIIKKACDRLKQDSFAVFIVGEVRDKKGNYVNFVGDTVQAFINAGLSYYNEAILLTMIGTLPIRAGKSFSASRKLGKTHQNILVFVKGEGAKAAKRCGIVEVEESLFDITEEEIYKDSYNQESLTKTIKISSKMANLQFAGCSPSYIKNVCHASCCQSSTSNTGVKITIHPDEIKTISSLGGVVIDGLLQPRTGEKKCPFKKADDLCGLHFTPDKPFGCIASPFTLTGETLIVRNRYKLLKCYKDGDKLPAYKAFRASLDLILGIDEAERVCKHFSAGGGDILATITNKHYEMLKTNDDIKKAVA